MKVTGSLVVVALLTGCAGAGNLQVELAKARAELMYLHAQPIAERQPGTVALGNVVVEATLPPETKVEKTGGFVVPLLFVNFWKAEYRTQLGAAQLQNDLPTFTRASLAEALRRGARYGWADEGGDLTVDATVRTVTLNAPMLEGGNFMFLLLFWSYGHTFQAGPATVVLDGEVVVRRGDAVLVRKPVQVKARGGILQGPKARIQDYTPAMAEAVSLAVKGFADQVVATVNGI